MKKGVAISFIIVVLLFTSLTFTSAGLIDWVRSIFGGKVQLAPINGAPTNLRAEAQACTGSNCPVLLMWEYPGYVYNEYSFGIQRATSPAGPFTGIAGTILLNFTDKQVVANTTYYYRVSVGNRSRATSDYSNVVSVTTGGTRNSCTDSDEGLYYDSPGSVTLYDGATITQTLYDTCASASSLTEYTCAGTSAAINTFDCASQGRVCDDGACVSMSPQALCLDNPTNYWDQQTETCKTGYSSSVIKSLCSDPDGGINLSVQTHAFGFRSVYADDRDKRIRTGGRDGCGPGTQIIEHSCDANGYIQANYLNCPSGQVCSNGACIAGTLPTPTCAQFGYNTQNGALVLCANSTTQYNLNVCSNVTNTCSDPDGTNYYNSTNVSIGMSNVPGPACPGQPGAGTGGGGGRIADRCLSSAILQEGICIGTTGSYLNYSCQNGCLNGACLQQPQVNETCIDSDGASTTTQGVVRLANDTLLTDFCLTTSLVGEYTCLANGRFNKTYTACAATGRVCSNGACVTQTQGNTSNTCNQKKVQIVGIADPSGKLSVAYLAANFTLGEINLIQSNRAPYAQKCNVTAGGCGTGNTNGMTSCNFVTTCPYPQPGTTGYVIINDSSLACKGATYSTYQYSMVNTTSSLCTDSDGGTDFYVKGVAYSPNTGNMEDYCVTERNLSELVEYTCDNRPGVPPTTSFEIYQCPYGCLNGACVQQPPQVCSEIIAKEGAIYNNNTLDGYTLTKTENYTTEDFVDLGNATIYYAEYKNDLQQKQLLVYTYVMNDKNVDIKNSKIIQEEVREELAWSGGTLSVDGVDNQYYSFGEDGGLVSLWFNDNVLILMGVFSNNAKEEHRTLNLDQVITRLQSNEFTPIETNKENLILLQQITRDHLAFCPSKVEESCYPLWQAKVEPIICPEYGFQTITYRDSNYCTSETKERRSYCSPGICSGCYVPRWLGYDNGENVCIPYGTRLEHQSEDTERWYEEEFNNEDEVQLEFVSSDEAVLTLIGKEYNNSYNLREGWIIDISFPGSSEVTRVRIDNIQYSENSNARNYIDITFIDTFDAYCNYDGNIGAQRGDEATCQNNYECFSNECRAGLCVNTYVTTVENAGLLTKIYCRVTNLFSGQDDYLQCLETRA